MLNELINLLQPPKPFAKGPHPLWEDAHISTRMLAAHLDAGFEGASRSPAFMDASAAFIAGQMPPQAYPRLVDLGCGPGLYAQRLARLGYAVTGCDISPGSIAYAQQQAAKDGQDISYRVQNYLQLEEEAQYNAAVLIYCDYGALADKERALLLQNVHRALVGGGRLLLDVFTPAKRAAFEELRTWRTFPAGGFWSGEPHLVLQHNQKYPGSLTLEQTVVLLEGAARPYYIWNCYFTPAQLAQEAQAVGFKVLGYWGDVAGAPYTEQGETLAMLLEKP